MTKEEANKKYSIGTRVKRGPDWIFGRQDVDEFGNQNKGTISGSTIYYINGEIWVYVKWDNGTTHVYRIFPEQDIILCSDVDLGPDPKNNDGRAICFWCNVATQKRGGGCYDVCPKCGK